MRTVAVDTETFPIGPGAVVPKLVCTSAAWDDEVALVGNGDDLYDFVRWLLTDDDLRLVFHNAGFDLAVIRAAYPDLAPAIWRALDREDRVTDTAVREKLYNIGTHGRADYRVAPDGSNARIGYSLADLAELHLGLDVRASKEGPEDSWRYNFCALDGLRAADYPVEAAEYAKGDAALTLGVWEAQERRSAGIGPGRWGTLHGEFFQTAVTFPLQIITARGMATDQAEVDRIAAWVERRMAPERMSLLLESGILRAAELPRPHKNQAKKIAAATKMPVDAIKAHLADGIEWAPDELDAMRTAGVKFTAGSKPSVDAKALKARVEAVCAEHGIEVKRTDPSGEFPDGQVSTDDSVMVRLALLDPVLAQYKDRQDIAQIASTEVPRMRAPVVHFRYDVLKETFRTSSSGGKRGEQLYPATNGQNVNPRVRRAYVARPGHLLLSADYGSLELVTLAQKCLDLFGRSVLADRINAGINPHSYLGSQIALHLHEDFREAAADIVGDPLKVYEAFMSLKKSGDPDLTAIYDKHRKMAKPTGLGYPGGLGPRKFITLAAGKAYRVSVDLPMAELLREIWFDTYPEMRRYFEWVNHQSRDPDNVGEVDEDGVPVQKYAYTSPLGHYRAGCTYTAAANGAGLQSFAADGFKVAIFDAVRCTDDPDRGSILYGTRVVNEVHDELILELEDDDRATARAQELCAVMVRAMRSVVKDVKITVEPALMRRWDKRAEPVWVDGRLVPWEPPAGEKDEIDEDMAEAPEGASPDEES